MNLEQLRADAADGVTETVVLAFADMQGRLQGKRLSARFFLDEVAGRHAEACNYLLAVDVDMNTVDGYDMSSWERGYGDFVMVPDMSTLRRVPWQPGSVLVIADLTWHDGAPVMASPRQILAAQIEQLASRGWTALAGTELEFIVYQDSYEQAAARDYRDLTPANQYNVDYSILGTGRIEPLLRRIRNEMAGAGLYVESAKGECNLGQHGAGCSPWRNSGPRSVRARSTPWCSPSPTCRAGWRASACRRSSSWRRWPNTTPRAATTCSPWTWT